MFSFVTDSDFEHKFSPFMLIGGGDHDFSSSWPPPMSGFRQGCQALKKSISTEFFLRKFHADKMQVDMCCGDTPRLSISPMASPGIKHVSVPSQASHLWSRGSFVFSIF
ncbi:hypothetical protein TWF106_006985 [Orbilia oligospora]|uniref:Uncharacterized protein n=1 Tax=Orbilia oligospora TaxID=2813651 RepID=A0A6G1MLA6_ORBOL|nr:hypothetical protein TWF788_000561 [Orbilia oligospora]KAF3213249.1 hypothetical protein TWF679_005477 [Orbilia oligospora]KAF3219564.1 hypothetical protein TWF106_006985 [Orbilia oligospora]KAF3230384.1 hypothetical protein TWF191_010272 [Orbilia oligospora]KAF3260500.1 hypothetical protein TWF192_009779 [Orbilia oligospora]